VVEKYRDALKIEDHMYNPLDKDRLDNQCKEFQHFAKQIMGMLKTLTKTIASYSLNKSSIIIDYKNFLGILDKYEELNLANYVEGDDSKLLFGNKSNSETENIKEAIGIMSESLKNPYFNLYHWCRGEYLDIQAVNEALVARDFLSEKISKRQKKKVNTQSDLDNLTTGRKTVKTLFKN
jgi:hypothetical protein